ncbi:ATP-binding protein [Streptomyces sp. NPDC093261]|uniref:ATP-binding protein n=1 Tax=Streptomyces sp. NPDC093261 TaxID=3366037 RepID=UPI003829CAFC
MKQSAAKTLGVAALGAAFATAGAGVASAAPAVPDIAGPADTATQALPLGHVAGTLPGAGEVLGQGQRALDTAVPTVGRAAADGPAVPVGGLLGGLPVKPLPTQGLPLNGIPLA